MNILSYAFDFDKSRMLLKRLSTNGVELAYCHTILRQLDQKGQVLEQEISSGSLNGRTFVMRNAYDNGDHVSKNKYWGFRHSDQACRIVYNAGGRTADAFWCPFKFHKYKNYSDVYIL